MKLVEEEKKFDPEKELTIKVTQAELVYLLASLHSVTILDLSNSLKWHKVPDELRVFDLDGKDFGQWVDEVGYEMEKLGFWKEDF